MEKKDIDLKYYAKVHSIESFGTVDGPGIRFVLFLQGCHLQCKYCHNRDTWNMNGGEYKSLDDIFEKIMKYKNYIYPNGGVTVTGGEPLLQVKFLIELFEKLKKENIHTCIDTSGMVALTDDIKNDNIYYALEGYLFPDTYSFTYDVTAEKIIETMLNQTNKVFSKYRSEFSSSSYSINEIVALSSVVEKEGIYDKDRKMIAGVFYNRLNANMPLGSDVTTYYANKIELGERDLTSSELNTYNPYNTRGPGMNGKLPVGAISNFGESSLKAVLNPDDNDYYYFVADKSGKTHFTKTYAEHQKIIKELKAANNWIEW